MSTVTRMTTGMMTMETRAKTKLLMMQKISRSRHSSRKLETLSKGDLPNTLENYQVGILTMTGSQCLIIPHLELAIRGNFHLASSLGRCLSCIVLRGWVCLHGSPKACIWLVLTPSPISDVLHRWFSANSLSIASLPPIIQKECHRLSNKSTTMDMHPAYYLCMISKWKQKWKVKGKNVYQLECTFTWIQLSRIPQQSWSERRGLLWHWNVEL